MDRAVRIHVGEFDGEIRVRAVGGNEQLRGNPAGDFGRFRQNVAGKD